jgi:hypothetical protein
MLGAVGHFCGALLNYSLRGVHFGGDVQPEKLEDLE